MIALDEMIGWVVWNRHTVILEKSGYGPPADLHVRKELTIAAFERCLVTSH